MNCSWSQRLPLLGEWTTKSVCHVWYTIKITVQDRYAVINEKLMKFLQSSVTSTNLNRRYWRKSASQRQSDVYKPNPLPRFLPNFLPFTANTSCTTHTAATIRPQSSKEDSKRESTSGELYHQKRSRTEGSIEEIPPQWSLQRTQ